MQEWGREDIFKDSKTMKYYKILQSLDKNFLKVAARGQNEFLDIKNIIV